MMAQPGQVVSTWLQGGQGVRGMPHPSILVEERVDGSWSAVVCTSWPRDDTLFIKDWKTVGLNSPTYLYSGQLRRILSDDIEFTIGTATPRLIDQVVTKAGLTGRMAARLRAASQTEQPPHTV